MEDTHETARAIVTIPDNLDHRYILHKDSTMKHNTKSKAVVFRGYTLPQVVGLELMTFCVLDRC